ncbi:MAG: YeiH family protein [Rhodoblastus sp.]
MDSDFDTDSASAQALYQSYDGMEGLVVAAPAPPARDWRASFARTYPGVLVAGVIALASSWLAQHYNAPVMLFALLIGMAFHFLHEDGRCVSGIEFSSKAVLRFGVALLGARITAHQIFGLGTQPILIVVCGIATTIGIGWLAAQWLGLRRTFGVLSGGSVAICGASAALAIASVLPRTPEGERDTILTVVTVTLLSTVAMVIYPVIAVGLGFDNNLAGVFLGATIHDVAQVVGAGYSISTTTGDVATYVKLLRVAMLLPVVFGIAFVLSRASRGEKGGAKVNFPFFLVAFAALVVVNSFGLLPGFALAAANEASRWCLVVAIAALGMKTSFQKLAAVGWRPIGLMVAETLWLAVLVLAILRWG